MVSFRDAVEMFYRRYTDFDGRSTRSEYWWVQLFYVIALIVLCLPLFIFTSSNGDPSGIGFIPLGIFVLAGIIPMIALTVRRFHDQDKSGWFYLINFIPYIGGLIVLVFMCITGTNGPNRFGEDQLNSYGDIFE